jgi:hypothetical protein
MCHPTDARLIFGHSSPMIIVRFRLKLSATVIRSKQGPIGPRELP